MSIKSLKRSQGIVASTNLEKALGRQLFFQADPTLIEAVTTSEAQEFFAGGDFFYFDIKPLLKYLPRIEAEIVYLLYFLKKNQDDVGKILNLSQPTISAKYHRALLKLRYLSLLHFIDLDTLLGDIPGITPEEIDILHDLFYFLNQEAVAHRYSVLQTRVRYVFGKALSAVLSAEQESPLYFFNHVGVFLFAQRFMRLRIRADKRIDSYDQPRHRNSRPSPHDLEDTRKVTS